MSSRKTFTKRLISLMLVVTALMSVMTVGLSSSASAADTTKTVYFSSNGYWTKLFAVYAWGDTFDSGEWSALNAVSGKSDLYSTDIPADYNNIIFCSREIPAEDWDSVINQTESLTIPENCNYLSLSSETTAVWGIYTPSEDVETTQTIYFVPNSEWCEIQYILCHEYVLHAYNSTDTEGVWVAMELVEGSYGTYPSTWAAEIDTAYTSVEFCRVEYTGEDTWEEWESTNVQTIPDNKNLFTQNEDSATGTWSLTEAIEPTIPAATEPATEAETTPVTTPVDSEEEPEATITVYFTPNDTWAETVDSSIGRISAYAWNSQTQEGTWYWLEDSSGEAEYYVDINAEYDSIYFGVSYSEEPDGVWNQTDDQTIPADANHFTQDSDDDATGTWNYIEVTEEAGNSYYVVFVDYDSKLISAQVVTEGSAATAPADPVRAGYTFLGWDKTFTNVTSNLTVTAKYQKNSDEESSVSTTGKLQIEVSGGTGFTIAINGGAARPQGTSYLNTKAPKNVSVTVVSSTSSDNQFIGWVNIAGTIVSTSETYTFTTSGDDYIKAMYHTDVEGVNAIIFKNSKAASGNGQILDMQYYTSSDKFVAPNTPSQAGYTFAGWDTTKAQARAQLEAGNDVIINAVWEVVINYVKVSVVNGTVNGATSAEVNAFNATTVIADTAADGKKFAYWTDSNGKVVSYDAEYKFYPAEDTALTANYVATGAEVEYEPIVGVAADPTTDGEKITYVLSWDIKAEIGTVTNAGMMIVNKNDYNADTFYHGTTDTNVFDRALASAQIKAKNTYTIAKSSSYYDNTYIACTWVIYTDASTGESVTVYSDPVEVTKLG